MLWLATQIHKLLQKVLCKNPNELSGQLNISSCWKIMWNLLHYYMPQDTNKSKCLQFSLRNCICNKAIMCSVASSHYGLGGFCLVSAVLFLLWPGCTACGSEFPGVLTTGPPGKSWLSIFRCSLIWFCVFIQWILYLPFPFLRCVFRNV